MEKNQEKKTMDVVNNIAIIIKNKGKKQCQGLIEIEDSIIVKNMLKD